MTLKMYKRLANFISSQRTQARNRMVRRTRSHQLERLEFRSMLATVSLFPVSDTTLYQRAAGDRANGAGEYLFAGVTNQGANNIRRALLKFDVAGSLPAGARIDAVSLRMTVSRVPTDPQSGDMTLHKVLADWGEGSTNVNGEFEGQGATPTANSATWVHTFFPSTNWATPGGVFTATPSATRNITGLGDYQWTTNTQLVADVQSWVDSPATQFGWLLKATDETNKLNARRFNAREHSENRPQLTIEFTAPNQNQAPTINAIANPAPILEDANAQTVNLTGISAGPGETQVITITATSNNPGLIPNPTVTYTSPNATGSLAFTPVANQSGTAVITVTVRDNGGTSGGGVDTTTRSFTVTVNPVNDAPTLDAIANPTAILEDASGQSINLAGISTGANESQTLTVSASSSNTSLIPNPTVTYSSPNATGSISYTPVANQFGTAVISVTVTDNGGTANGGVDAVTRSFTVTVTGVNDLPSIDAIANPAAIAEDAGLQTVNLTGISAGPAESQVITITASSNNTSLISNPSVVYSSPNATGSLTYTPVPNQSGTAIITVTVQDNGGTANGGADTTSRTFTVSVNAVNDPPTLAAIADPEVVPEDSAIQSVSLSGIAAGGNETQTLTVSASSSNTSLIPNPTVTYTSANTTGSLEYTPVANQFGSAVITVTVQDNGGTANGGVDSTTRSFTVSVSGVNDAPTLNAINNLSVAEGAGAQTVNLTGISAGPAETQTITISASSSNLGLIPNPTVNYTSANAAGSLSFTPVSNQSGVATISVTVRDDGGIANGGIDTLVRTFTVTVSSVNNPPTLDAIADPAAILEDAGLQTVNLSGVTAGTGENQPLTVTASSSNPGLIPNPTVNYTSPNTTGSLTYTPVPNQSGIATITVTVMDDGGATDTLTRTFSVTVTAVNDEPTFNAINNPGSILEDAGVQSLNLSGITAGPNEVQNLTVSAVSNNPALVSNPTVTYSSPGATGSLSYSPNPNQSGTATIVVTVRDNGGTASGGIDATARTFTVTVTPVNDVPTLDVIGNPAPILEDAASQTINLTGISAGANESQNLTVTATSGNLQLIPNPAVTYTSPSAAGTLTFTPVANQSGTSTIVVTVKDNGGTANGGIDVTTQTITITVTPVNDAPTLDSIPNPAVLLEDAGSQSVNLTGITSGAGESQSITVTAESSNTALIPNPEISYTSPNSSGTMSFLPVPNQSGSAIITVTVKDSGGALNGGIDTIVRSFTVSVSAVNDPPSIDSIASPAVILEDAGSQVVNVTGITAGVGETQNLVVTAVSDNTALIPSPAVTYTSPNSSASLSYTPVANQFGTARIVVTVQDNGGTANGGVDSSTQTFTVTVNSVNDAPSLDSIANPAPISEDAAAQTISLAGISAGVSESQGVTITAVSNNPNLIPNPTVNYTSPDQVGSLSYAPVANQSGTATIVVMAKDDGGTANGGIDSVARTFTVTVLPVNDAPSIDPISDPPAILEDAATQLLNLPGISAGPSEFQTVTISAVSNNPSLVPNPTISFTNPNTTGTLSYAPVANQSGVAVITVTLSDDGGLANGGSDTTTRSFTISVTAVNDAPTLNAIAEPAPFLVDPGPQTINLTGIGSGGGETQTLSVVATSSDPAIVPNPTIDYTSPGATGTLTFTPAAGQSGTAVITVTVTDNGGTSNGGVERFSRSFRVTIVPPGANLPPTFNLIPDPAPILEDAAQQSVNVTGIGPGGAETQTLTLTAVSSNASLIPNPAVTYSSPNSTGLLTITPVPNQFGTATITVTLRDDGGTNNGGIDTTAQTFTVTILPVNDPPSLTSLANPASILEDADTQILNLSGITSGPNESQQAVITAQSSNPTLIPNPTVVYTSPGATGSLSYKPNPNQSGTATVVVNVLDNGGTDNGGVDSVSQTITITVSPVNDAPTLDVIGNPAPILEDSPTQSLSLTGITPGPGESQQLTITAVSGNPALLPNPEVIFASPSTTATLNYTPAANQSGVTTVVVSVSDNGGTANGGTDTIRQTFTVTVTATNDAPTLDVIVDPAPISEDSGVQTVNLSGITSGPNESQQFTVSALSNNTALIPNPTVNHSGSASTATIGFTPVPNQSGTATIVVSVTDNGGTANGGASTISRTFTVTVTAVNDAPTLGPIPGLSPVPEDSGVQVVSLAGISAGPSETQVISISAVSTNPSLISNPTVQYTSPSATGSLSFTPSLNQFGVTTIVVTLQDNGGQANGGSDTVTQTITVTVSPVNDPPQLAAIPDPAVILEDAGTQTINLAGILAGPTETQVLTVTALSSNPNVIPNPTVSYNSPSATGSISFAPASNQSGVVSIIVTVSDDGGTSNGGIATTSRTITVTVDAVNDPPAFEPGGNASAFDDSPAQSVTGWATGMSAGPADEAAQTVTFQVTNSNNGLFAVQPAIDSTGRMTFTPKPNTRGTADVSVVLVDNGGTANGGNNSSPPRVFQISIGKEFPWHNSIDASDVDGDSIVAPIDALLVINYINEGRSAAVPPDAPLGPRFFDTSRDNFVVPIDVLLIINVLNSGSPEGEGIAPFQLHQELIISSRGPLSGSVEERSEDLATTGSRSASEVGTADASPFRDFGDPGQEDVSWLDELLDDLARHHPRRTETIDLE